MCPYECPYVSVSPGVQFFFGGRDDVFASSLK